MFNRRLRIFVAVIFAISLMLFGRVFQVQVIAHSYWDSQAIGLLTKPQITETTRGRILDIHGTPLAVDMPCTDACVDYRAIIDPPDPKWVQTIAIARLRNRLGADYRAARADQRKTMLNDEIKQTLADIKSMWQTLAILNPKVDEHADRPAAISSIRQGIVEAVQERRKKVASYHLQADLAQEKATSRWLRWLARSHDDDDSDDNLSTIEEQQEAHVILPALDSDACNLLGKRLESLPGLQLRASTHRLYPLDSVACHLLGNVWGVSAQDLIRAKKDNLDELRTYGPNDLIGREGIEGLCEPLLRGTRGKIERRVSDDTVISQQDFVPGSDVQLSIDADLQKQAEQMLQHVTEFHLTEETKQREPITPEGGASMHAAIVVLDVKTNQVRVMASNPGFNLNDLQDHYAAMASDELNQPLINRATMDTLEPGSTVKPLIGLGAITDGVLQPDETINCTGYLYLPEKGPNGILRPTLIPGAARCWILSENMKTVEDYRAETKTMGLPSRVMHHELRYASALENSCDIFFETAADRLTPARVNYWFGQFGLGQPTGIGIAERAGLRPDLYRGGDKKSRVDNCLVGMGQGAVLATPLQIANEAATVARGGIWMRPRLLVADTQAALDAVTAPSSVPDRIDLHLNPEALRQARLGMINVVDGPSGTGKIDHPGVTLAAKTGTADAAELRVRMKDASGAIVRQKLMPVHPGDDEGPTPWYRSGKKRTGKDGDYSTVHSWYMGFAPADNPQIAFCVLVEYAGVGGSNSAGPIASQMLEACLRAGYLHPQTAVPSGNPVAFQQ